jgi:hypothetical protein
MAPRICIGIQRKAHFQLLPPREHQIERLEPHPSTRTYKTFKMVIQTNQYTLLLLFLIPIDLTALVSFRKSMAGIASLLMPSNIVFSFFYALATRKFDRRPMHGLHVSNEIPFLAEDVGGLITASNSAIKARVGVFMKTALD